MSCFHQPLCPVSTQVETRSEAKISNTPPQLQGSYIGFSFQFIASQDRRDLSGNEPLSCPKVTIKLCNMSAAILFKLIHSYRNTFNLIQ